jgi:hypothetical protein
MSAYDLAEPARFDSSEDEIEADGYETDLSSVADDPKPDPIKLRIEGGLEKLVGASTFPF